MFPKNQTTCICMMCAKYIWLILGSQWWCEWVIFHLRLVLHPHLFVFLKSKWPGHFGDTFGLLKTLQKILHSRFNTVKLTVRNTQTQWDKGLYTIWSRFYWKTTFISNIVTLVGNRQGPHLTWKKSLPVASGLGNQTGRQKPEADHRQRQTAHYLRTSERPQSVRENLHLAPHCSAFTLARSLS